MTKLKEIIEAFPDENFIVIDGFDDAVIGIYTGEEPFRLVYSIGEIVSCLVRDGMDENDAIEYYEYNTARSIPYVTNAPLLIYTDF